jgi:hypothetical protein
MLVRFEPVYSEFLFDLKTFRRWTFFGWSFITSKDVSIWRRGFEDPLAGKLPRWER